LENPGEFSNRLKDIARDLRVVLEEYLFVKFPTQWISDDWLGGMIGKIRDAEVGARLQACSHLVDDLTQVNDYSKKFHHRSNGFTGSIPDATELKSYVSQTLDIISR